LGSTEKSNDPDLAEPDSIVRPKDEAEAISQKENTAIEENDKLKLNSNADRADKNVPSGRDTSENCGEISASVIENPSASEKEKDDTSDQCENCEISSSVIENPSASEDGKNQIDTDIICKENTADKSCEVHVIENLNSTTEETPKLSINGGDVIVDEKVTML
jgi:hypothetical protein